MERQQFEPLDDETEKLITAVIDCAFRVYVTLGPGLLESVYETCMCHELKKRGITYERQFHVPIVYDDVQLTDGLRIDLFIEKRIIVELKAVEEMLPVFQSQLITYLKLTNNRIGLLINFNVSNFKGAIKRIIL